MTENLPRSVPVDIDGAVAAIKNPRAAGWEKVVAVNSLAAELERLRRIEEAATKAWVLLPVDLRAYELLSDALRRNVPNVASIQEDA